MLDGLCGVELGEYLFGSVDDAVGEAGELGDFYAVAFVGASRDNAAQERDLVAAFLDGYVIVLYAVEQLLHNGELVIVGSEQRACAELLLIGDILEHSASDAHTVVGRCTSAYLVEDEQAF